MSSSTAGPVDRPPPIPRRHPSRPSLRTPSSTAPPADETSDRPPVARRPTSSLFHGDEASKVGTIGLGFTGRVGLGSPRLEFFQRREGGGGDSQGSEEGKEGGRRGSYIDRDIGLPSPPGTESEVGYGLGIAASPSLDDMPRAEQVSNVRIPSSSRPRLQPRTPSVASSSGTTAAHQRTSSVTSHTQSSRRRLQPKVSSGMTRSTSSSSSIYNLSLRDVSLPGSSAGSPSMSDRTHTPSPVKKWSPAPSASAEGSRRSPAAASPVERLSRHSSRRSVGFPSSTSLEDMAEGVATGSRASSRSGGSEDTRRVNGGAGEGLVRRSSRLSVESYSSAEQDRRVEVETSREIVRRSTVDTGERSEREGERRRRGQEAAEPATKGETAVKLLRRISGGAELDDRIREAEEKVKRVNQRSSRPSTSTSTRDGRSPQKSTIRGADSSSPAPSRPSPVVPFANNTLRRSATLSSASARNHATAEELVSPERADASTTRDRGTWEDTERDRSGGSAGSGKRKPLPTEFRSSQPYTPSPKHTTHIGLPSSSSRSRVHQLAESPEERLSDLPSPSSHFTSPSRRTDSIDSPSSRFLRHEGIEGLDRSASSASRNREPYSRRQWSESLSGLPNLRTDTVDRGLPKLRDSRSMSRSASVMDSHSEQAPGSERRRYQSRSSTLSSSSRLALTPGDSISVVDTRSNHYESKKDPLEVLRRIEESRELHNRQWEEDRAVSVVGDFDSPARRYERPSSGEGRSRITSHARIRPATSMSSMREGSDRSAPINRLHRRTFEESQAESPSSSSRRATSRLSHGPPVTELRHKRSSTSVNGRAGASPLDAYATKTEHGRLLLEAFRALELKLPPDLLDAVPDLVKALQSTISAQETINTSVRDSLATANRTNVAIDLDNPNIDELRRDFDILLPLLREAGRASDQSIRELTRVILDLPKLLREGTKLGSTTPNTSRSAQHSSPTVRRSESILSRSSLDSTRSPDDYSSRRWQNTSGGSPVSGLSGARERRSLDVIRSSSSMASFVSRFRRSPGKGETMPLPPIDQSPPREYEPSPLDRGYSEERDLSSPHRRREREEQFHPNLSPGPAAAPPPKSPERFRNMLRKKASSTSTHTVRGSSGFSPLTQATATTTTSTPSTSAFFPSPIRRTTTAISQITVGDLSPPSASISRVKSLRSDRSGSFGDDRSGRDLDLGSPVSRFSFKGRMGSEEPEEGEGDEAVKVLAAAAKRRESETSIRQAERGSGSGSGTWKSGWRRGK
ncbi:uncharacterized protein MKK02DRAFT_43918 [Dioszegia hungarica]|uniref:Uncharacterized protein n=1 Tax=Dioszegia hungarica TaxID=4972 RepID=A0AA38H7M9_9TREE|nr:uncharacterized protein MKK02DRAFT_43918 [Dioszegia hungarica]KAI9635238.1 hypothetical protein MKK02DRAFT_43918 [Dioszegia hungarica]